MAKREELHIIRSARAGQSAAQLALGKRYLFGGGGLPVSAETALYWLDRAAKQEEPGAWMLIGSHVPFEVAQRTPQPTALIAWYERAYDAGIVEAGLVLARLVFKHAESVVSDALMRKAMLALEAAARAGIAEAQWLLAQRIGSEKNQAAIAVPPSTDARAAAAGGSAPASDRAMLQWATVAADSGVLEARFALAEHAWASANYPVFLERALPLARVLTEQSGKALSDADAQLLFRCAKALMDTAGLDDAEVVRLLDLAAQSHHHEAQCALGLWFARIDENGARIERGAGVAHYKKAIRWLTMAGEAGLAGAWYALSKIYTKPEFSQRSLGDAQRYLMLAAKAGHCKAQLDLGVSAWRLRRSEESNDIRAAYWLQKAAAQGCAEAAAMREKCALPAMPAAWADALFKRLGRDIIRLYPFLAARIELAARFGLSPPETLLIDMNQADCGHCLVVDVRALYHRARRRLILVQTGEERQALNRIRRLFDDVDCGPDGPEGNYRQRLYRLKTLSASIEC